VIACQATTSQVGLMQTTLQLHAAVSPSWIYSMLLHIINLKI